VLQIGLGELFFLRDFHRKGLLCMKRISRRFKFLYMKTLFAVLFFIATGVYVCLSYILMQLIDMNSKSEFVILDVAGLFANILLINFLFSKYINQPFDKRSNKH
jgi:hypothetical protein